MDIISNSSKETLDDFPKEVFNQKQRLDGGVIFYITAAIYCCYALFAICDSYFIPALHILIKRLGLANDVAGATIMATASAAPGFFISIIGTFVIHNDLGLGNIIGSCVFNVYAMIGVCGLLIKQEIHLEWWPITRDFAYYMLSLVILAVTLIDKKIYWYEALTLLTTYVFYILVLNNSEQLKCFIEHNLERFNMQQSPFLKENKTEDTNSSQESKDNHPEVVVEKNEPVKKKTEVQTEFSTTNDIFKKKETLFDNTSSIMCPDCLKKNSALKEEQSKLTIPSSLSGKLIWLITLPIDIVYCMTVPDCKKEKWEKFYLMTFVISIIYIGSITYVVSWMVTVIGVTFFISDAIMGYTALAIGTSMPDLFCSLAVARQGFGNMALANGIGSNIIDILVNLSIPWLIKCMLPGSNGYSSVPDRNVIFIVAVMTVSVFPIFGVFLRYHFNLNRKVAFISLCLYIIFITVSVLLSVL